MNKRFDMEEFNTLLYWYCLTKVKTRKKDLCNFVDFEIRRNVKKAVERIKIVNEHESLTEWNHAVVLVNKHIAEVKKEWGIQ